MDTTGWHEVWRQDYDTERRDDWELDRRIKDRALAEEYVASISGWGTDARIGNPAEDTSAREEWQALSKAEFDARYVMQSGYVFERESDTGREILARREREEQRRREFEEIRALKPIGGKRKA